MSITKPTPAAQLLARLGLETDKPNVGVYNGTWKASGPVVQQRNPATGEVLAEVQEGNEADLEEAVVKAREAYKQWRMVPAPRRGEVLREYRVL